MQQFMARDAALRVRVQRLERVRQQHYGIDVTDRRRAGHIARQAEQRIGSDQSGRFTDRFGSRRKGNGKLAVTMELPETDSQPGKLCQYPKPKNPGNDRGSTKCVDGGRRRQNVPPQWRGTPATAESQAGRNTE